MLNRKRRACERERRQHLKGKEIENDLKGLLQITQFEQYKHLSAIAKAATRAAAAMIPTSGVELFFGERSKSRCVATRATTPIRPGGASIQIGYGRESEIIRKQEQVWQRRTNI